MKMKWRPYAADANTWGRWRALEGRSILQLLLGLIPSLHVFR